MTTLVQSAMGSLAEAAHDALQRAIANQGKLPPEVLAMEGMSGRKYRLFINNLIGGLSGAKYLEVGVWKGSTLCSAIHGNAVSALAIDNWSEFGGPSTEFLANLASFKTREARVSFIESDFRAVDYGSLGKFDVYLFDGPHSQQDQYDGIALALPALEEQFVLIIDDWNWDQVRAGTFAAIAAVGLQVDFMAEIRTSLDGTHGPVEGQKGDWHNGYFIAALSKTARSRA